MSGKSALPVRSRLHPRLLLPIASARHATQALSKMKLPSSSARACDIAALAAKSRSRRQRRPIGNVLVAFGTRSSPFSGALKIATLAQSADLAKRRSLPSLRALTVSVGHVPLASLRMCLGKRHAPHLTSVQQAAVRQARLRHRPIAAAQCVPKTSTSRTERCYHAVLRHGAARVRRTMRRRPPLLTDHAVRVSFWPASNHDPATTRVGATGPRCVISFQLNS